MISTHCAVEGLSQQCHDRSALVPRDGFLAITDQHGAKEVGLLVVELKEALRTPVQGKGMISMLFGG